MNGSQRFYVGFGVFGAVLTFLFSISSNPLTTTLLRSLYAFAVFFAIAFAVKLLLGQLIHPAAKREDSVAPEEERGAAVDMTTPDEDEQLSELMKEQWADGRGEPAKPFQPLTPKRLVSLDNPNPEQVVQAIRRLTDE